MTDRLLDPPAGSYDRGDGAALDAEVARLDVQAGLSFAEELRILRELGLTDGQHVVEVGCGPGAVTARLHAALPASPLTALDVDPVLLGLARARLAGTPVRLGLAGVHALPLASGSADVVLARFLLQHLADPVAALREMARVLRPGGLLAVVDIDAGLWGAADPRVGGLEDVYARTGKAQAGAGGDRLVGRRLWPLLHRAGLHDIAVRPFAYHSGDLGLEAFDPQLDPARLLPLVDAGVLGLREYGTAVAAYSRFRHDDDAFVLLLGWLVAGRPG